MHLNLYYFLKFPYNFYLSITYKQFDFIKKKFNFQFKLNFKAQIPSCFNFST